MVCKYRKKPVEIYAIQYTGQNRGEIESFCGKDCFGYDSEGTLFIRTLEGDMTARIGDFIIKGIRGEFYPCKPDVFEKTYDMVKE